MSNLLLSKLSKVLCALILAAVYLFQAGTATAQVSGYNLTSVGNFTPLSGANVQTLAAGTRDDGYYPLAPIGFNFRYDNVNYTDVGANTNGWMKMGTLASDNNQNSFNNDLSGTPNRPLIAPLWDDLEVNSTGSVSYLTEGVAPNRVFTMQWLNMEWSYLGTAPTISFQVKLYETSNRIQFIYRQEAAALTPATDAGTSIGLAGTAAGTFLSLTDSGPSPAASSTTESSAIFVKPANGQSYLFTPVAPTAAGVSISGRVLTSSGAGLVNATVYLTDRTGAVQTSRTTTFGNYHFENVAAGQTVLITVVSKRYQFSPQVVNVNDNLADLNFIAEESK